MGDITGRCFCGQVCYESAGPVLWAGHCHCESCRRATAAPMTSFFGVPRDSVMWTGALTRHETSEGRVARLFCGSCGTQMTYQAEVWPDETHLYAATLDDPSHFRPEAHYHYAERVPWLTIDDDLAKHPGSADA